MKYTTQMNAARQGIVTKEMEAVAAYEGIDVKDLMAEVAAGTIVIPANKNHKCLKPFGIGNSLKTKINVNLGTSRDCKDLDMELEKVNYAVGMGAESIMDLSSWGDTQKFRRKLTAECPAIIGTVPIYDAVVYYHKPLKDITTEEWLKIVEMHAEDGVDFMTVHCGITKELVDRLKRSPRVTGVVSRGGSFLVAWILHNEMENPLYKNFDYLLELAKEYEFTLSLGDGIRPGSTNDATDGPQINELINLGELVHRCRDAGVQAMVEGPGHVPMNQIEANVRLEKRICDHAPFYVLGPLVTDIAPGYDHIVGAIGGAYAAWKGADFLCYVTPAEHLSLPTPEDVKEGLIASKIAAHAADLALGRGGDRDLRMSQARKDLNWGAMYEEAIDEEKARAYRSRGITNEDEGCSMCGDVCAIKIVNEYLKNRS